MCIDYTDLNKHCPKDPFPLSCIDQVVDSTAGSILLCFLDCYSGYHQIAHDKDKTTLIISHDIYYYNSKVVEDPNWEKCRSLCGRCSRQDYRKDKLIADLTETFANLREYQWKLNPTKCVFGVPSGLLLGFMVGHQGIEANPAKIDAIRKMAKPSNKKDVMKLTGMMATLGHFISKLGEKGLPFFKLLKKADKYVWGDEA
jgi:hypothetical protein